MNFALSETNAMDALACFDEALQIEPGHFETLLAKAAILARLARTMNVGSATLCAAAVEHMRDEKARARYVQPHVARFTCYLNRALELLDQAAVIKPDDERIVALRGHSTRSTRICSNGSMNARAENDT